MKLAEGEICKSESGEYPILLFDDVFSELDSTRRAYLLNKIDKKQVIMTGCETGIFDDTDARIIYVEGGKYFEPKAE